MRLPSPRCRAPSPAGEGWGEGKVFRIYLSHLLLTNQHVC